MEIEKDVYKTSRFFYILEAAFEYFINLLLIGAYLAKVTTTIGIPDSLTGILTSFVSLGYFFQIIAIFLANKKPVKRWVTVLHSINQIFFACIYLVPLFNFSKTVKIFLFIIFLLVGHIVNNIVNASKINWFMALVDDKKRGSFTASKEMVSLIGGMTFTFIVGSVMDSFEAAGNITGMFIFCSIGVFGLTLLHTLTLIFSKEKTEVVNKSQSPIQTVKNLIQDKKLIKVIWICCIWSIANYATTPFYGTYQIKELGFTMTFVSILSVVYSVVRTLMSKPLGRYADKFSFVKMMIICFVIQFFAFLVNVFTVPENGKIFYTVYYVLYAMGMAGINSGEINLIYDNVKPEQRTGALALRATFSGLAGFLTTLVVSILVENVQASGNKILGVNVYAQQVVSAIGVIVVLVGLIYLTVNKDLEKNKNIEQIDK